MSQNWQNRGVEGTETRLGDVTVQVMIFSLKDYLSPGGKYPRELLEPDLTACVEAGMICRLTNVAGHFMLSGYPQVGTNAAPVMFFKGDETYESASAAMAF